MEQENLQVETIYVAIASLHDMELKRTLQDAFAKASNPDRVHIGVAVQDINSALYKEIKQEFAGNPNVKLSFTKLKRRKLMQQLGVGLGRAKSHGFYDGQDYVLQVDSHTMFEQDWDATLIDTYKAAKFYVRNDKLVLTAYAGNYYLDENGERSLVGSEQEGEHAGFHYPLFSKFQKKINVIPLWDLVPFSMITDAELRFVPAPKFNANFAFGDSQFAKDLGLETSFLFFEEEIIQSLNLMGNGWSLVFPNIPTATIRHLYATKDSKVAKTRMAASDYLPEDLATDFTHKQMLNYRNFLNDETRVNARASYERYAKISLEFGRQTNDTMFPDTWVLDMFDGDEVQRRFTEGVTGKPLEISPEAHEDSEGCGCKTKHDHAEEKSPEPVKESRPWDLLNPNIGRVSEEIKEMRMDACRNCEFFIKLTQQCTKCGCIMPAKTGLPHSSCPIGKWDSVPDEGN